MIATLNVVLFVLWTVMVLACIAIALIAADYLFYEYVEYAKRKLTREKKLRADAERHSAVTALLEECEKNRERTRLRTQKEEEARQAFFEDGYFHGFDHDGRLIYRGAAAPTEPDWEFFKSVDEVVDVQIFENTRDL